MRYIRIVLISGTVLLILIALSLHIMSLSSTTVDKESDLPRANTAESTSNNNGEINTIEIVTAHVPHLIDGYVVDPWGSPVSGLKLRISSVANTNNLSANETNQVVSNNTGYFQFNVDQLGRYLIITDATAVFKSSTSPVSRTNRKIRIELSLKEQVVLFGRVTDTRGIPVPSAIISGRYNKKLAETDSIGRFQIVVAISLFGNPKISVARSGYQSLFITLDKKHYIDQQELEITLDFSTETMTVRGWIGNTYGQALPSQKIELLTPSINKFKSNTEDYSTYSDLGGFFEIEGVLVDNTYQLEVLPKTSHQKLINRNVYISTSMEPLKIILEPLELNSITGIITDFELNPLPNFKMSISSEASASYNNRFVTDDAGQFYIEQFPVGQVTFQTFRPPLYKVLGIEVSSSQIRVPIDYGWHIFSGRVNNIDGSPVRLALVELEANIKLGEIKSQSKRKTYTDRDGFFKFKNLGKGSHNLTVYIKGSPGYQQSYNIGHPNIVEHITLQ